MFAEGWKFGLSGVCGFGRREKLGEMRPVSVLLFCVPSIHHRLTNVGHINRVPCPPASHWIWLMRISGRRWGGGGRIEAATGVQSHSVKDDSLWPVDLSTQPSLSGGNCDPLLFIPSALQVLMMPSCTSPAVLTPPALFLHFGSTLANIHFIKLSSNYSI